MDTPRKSPGHAYARPFSPVTITRETNVVGGFPWEGLNPSLLSGFGDVACCDWLLLLWGFWLRCLPEVMVVVVSPTAEGLRMGFCPLKVWRTAHGSGGFPGPGLYRKRWRGGCADLPACGEALAPLRPHRLERPVAGPGGDGYAIWSLTGWPCTTGITSGETVLDVMF